MSFFNKLSNLFSTREKQDYSVYWIHVKCNRCGEVLSTRVNLNNDLSINYGESEDGSDTTYFCRKTLMGSGEGRCFQRVEVALTFDNHRNLINREVTGGNFVEPEES